MGDFYDVKRADQAVDQREKHEVSGHVQSALKDIFADTIQEMLEAEIESSLGYAKHDIKNKRTTKSRNVYSKKTVRSEYGEVDIQVPRDREGEFEPDIVQKHQSSVTGIED